VELHRTAGFKFRTQHEMLARFVIFAEQHGDEFVRVDRALEWAARAPSRDIVEALPLLPNTFPPMQVGDARRLDQPVTIRALAKSWSNCLASYLNDIDAGTCAVYLWQDSHATAACSVRKYGRLGWFLEQVKGPQNVGVEPGQLATIRSAFSEVGILDSLVIAAINCMIHEAHMDDIVF